MDFEAGPEGTDPIGIRSPDRVTVTSRCINYVILAAGTSEKSDVKLLGLVGKQFSVTGKVLVIEERSHFKAYLCRPT